MPSGSLRRRAPRRGSADHPQTAQGIGADLRYHGDYDWPGISIANYVIAKYGAVPWHFSAADYVAAAKSASQLTIPLSGRPVIASWDADLTAAMIKTGIKIEEEAIAERIIDLLGKEPL